MKINSNSFIRPKEFHTKMKLNLNKTVYIIKMLVLYLAITLMIQNTKLAHNDSFPDVITFRYYRYVERRQTVDTLWIFGMYTVGLDLYAVGLLTVYKLSKSTQWDGSHMLTA